MVEDKKISEAVEPLLKGGKMLKFHCPDCGLPLFQQNEKVFCPHCKTEFQIVEEEGDGRVMAKGLEKEYKEKDVERVDGFDAFKDSALLEENIEKLMGRLVKKAMATDNMYELRDIIKILRELSEIYRLVRG